MSRKRKAQNATNKITLLLFVFMVMGNMFGQKPLENYYFNKETSNWDFSDSYLFNKDGTFERESSGDVAIVEYGKGHYTLTKDSLILNYDLTEIRIRGYHILHPYTRFEDSLELRMTMYNIDNKLLKNRSKVRYTINGKTRSTGRSDDEGKIRIAYPKGKGIVNLDVCYNLSCYSFDLPMDDSYEIDVFLSELESYYHGKAIKNTIERFKVIKHKKDYIILENKQKGEITLRKSKKESSE